MLYIDGRAGSKDFIVPLKKVLGNTRVEEATLDFGDFAFEGRGAKDVPILVAIEHKKLSDIVQCCRDGRFAGHQLPGLRKSYEHAWLMIEGEWRADPASGLVTQAGKFGGWRPIPGKMKASEFEKHILTFELCGGVHVRHTNTRADSVRAIADLYRWFTDKTMDSHTSHLAVHEPASLGEVSAFRRAVMAWPHVGLKQSKVAERTFGSVERAAAGSVQEWANMATNGRRFGEANAQKLVNFLRGVKR